MFLRITAVITVCVFGWTSVVMASPQPVYAIKVPERHGQVKQRWRAPEKAAEHSAPSSTSAGEDKTVVIIQDAHSSSEAQENIASLIGSLVSQEDISVVSVEGAVGPLDLSQFRSFPVAAARDRVARDYISRGIFSGAEYSAIQSENAFQLHGAEDRALFAENFRTFYETLNKREDILSGIEELEDILNLLKEKIYAPQLRDFDSTFSSYTDGTINFLEFLPALFDQAQAVFGPRLHDRLLLEYTELNRFREAILRERALDHERAKDECARVRTALELVVDSRGADNSLFYDSIAGYDAGSLSEKEYVQCLRAYAIKHGIDLRAYQLFNQYREYLEAYGRIDFTRLMNDVVALARETYLGSAKTRDEKDLALLRYDVMLLKKLAELRAVNEEVAYFREHRREFDITYVRSQLQILCNKYGLPFGQNNKTAALMPIIDSIERFYEVAEARNEALIDNTLLAMDQTGENNAILVGGGYHTPGLTDVLRSRNINYLVVTPSISSVIEDVPYIEKMTGGLYPLAPQLISHINGLTTYITGDITALVTDFTNEGIAEAIRTELLRAGVTDVDAVVKQLSVLQSIDAGFTWDDIVDTVIALVRERVEDGEFDQDLAQKDIERATVLDLLATTDFRNDLSSALRGFFNGTPADSRGRETAGEETVLETATDERRDADEHAMYGRLLRESAAAKRLEMITAKGRGQEARVDNLRLLTNVLNSQNPLARLVDPRIEGGDMIAVFRIPGIAKEENRLGIKTSNDVLGYDLTSSVIEVVRYILRDLMKTSGLISGDQDMIDSSYKDAYFLIKDPDIEAASLRLRSIAPLVNERFFRIYEVESESALERSMSDYGYTDPRISELIRNTWHSLRSIGLTMNDILYEINVGGSIVEESTPRARLEAVINANQSIPLAAEGAAEIFDRSEYKDIVAQMRTLRRRLQELRPGLFDSSDTEFLNERTLGILREQRDWADLHATDPDGALLFGNDEIYALGRRYFNYFNVQDYIKRWPVDFDEAQAQSEAVLETIRALKERADELEGLDAFTLTDADEVLLKKAEQYIFQETKLPAVTSHVGFHGRAPPMSDPVYITLDVKGMGLKNLRAFQSELLEIEEALFGVETADWQRVEEIWRSAADDVTRDFFAAVKTVRSRIIDEMRTSGVSAPRIATLLGGDECTFAIEDGLALATPEFLHWIRETTGVRICASAAIEMFREHFRSREIGNELAHAQMLLTLEGDSEGSRSGGGISRLKYHEKAGRHAIVLIQNRSGDWIEYPAEDAGTASTEDIILRLTDLNRLDSHRETLGYTWGIDSTSITPEMIHELFLELDAYGEAAQHLKVKLLWHIVAATMELTGDDSAVINPLKTLYEMTLTDVSGEAMDNHAREFMQALQMGLGEDAPQWFVPMLGEVLREIEDAMAEYSSYTTARAAFDAIWARFDHVFSRLGLSQEELRRGTQPEQPATETAEVRPAEAPRDPATEAFIESLATGTESLIDVLLRDLMIRPLGAPLTDRSGKRSVPVTIGAMDFFDEIVQVYPSFDPATGEREYSYDARLLLFDGYPYALELQVYRYGNIQGPFFVFDLSDLVLFEEPQLAATLRQELAGFPGRVAFKMAPIDQWGIQEIPQLYGVYPADTVQSRTLIEAVRPFIDAGSTVLDYGCGSGIVGLALAQETGCTVDAIDYKKAALTNTRMAVKAQGLSDQVTVIESDSFTNLQDKRYDAICFYMPGGQGLGGAFDLKWRDGVSAVDSEKTVLEPLFSSLGEHLNDDGYLYVVVMKGDTPVYELIEAHDLAYRSLASIAAEDGTPWEMDSFDVLAIRPRADYGNGPTRADDAHMSEESDRLRGGRWPFLHQILSRFFSRTNLAQTGIEQTFIWGGVLAAALAAPLAQAFVIAGAVFAAFTFLHYIHYLLPGRAAQQAPPIEDIAAVGFVNALAIAPVFLSLIGLADLSGLMGVVLFVGSTLFHLSYNFDMARDTLRGARAARAGESRRSFLTKGLVAGVSALAGYNIVKVLGDVPIMYKEQKLGSLPREQTFTAAENACVTALQNEKVSVGTLIENRLQERLSPHVRSTPLWRGYVQALETNDWLKAAQTQRAISSEPLYAEIIAALSETPETRAIMDALEGLEEKVREQTDSRRPRSLSFKWGWLPVYGTTDLFEMVQEVIDGEETGRLFFEMHKANTVYARSAIAPGAIPVDIVQGHHYVLPHWAKHTKKKTAKKILVHCDAHSDLGVPGGDHGVLEEALRAGFAAGDSRTVYDGALQTEIGTFMAPAFLHELFDEMVWVVPEEARRRQYGGRVSENILPPDGTYEVLVVRSKETERISLLSPDGAFSFADAHASLSEVRADMDRPAEEREFEVVSFPVHILSGTSQAGDPTILERLRQIVGSQEIVFNIDNDFFGTRDPQNTKEYLTTIEFVLRGFKHIVQPRFNTTEARYRLFLKFFRDTFAELQSQISHVTIAESPVYSQADPRRPITSDLLDAIGIKADDRRQPDYIRSLLSLPGRFTTNDIDALQQGRSGPRLSNEEGFSALMLLPIIAGAVALSAYFVSALALVPAAGIATVCLGAAGFIFFLDSRAQRAQTAASKERQLSVIFGAKADQTARIQEKKDIDQLRAERDRLNSELFRQSRLIPGLKTQIMRRLADINSDADVIDPDSYDVLFELYEKHGRPAPDSIQIDEAQSGQFTQLMNERELLLLTIRLSEGLLASAREDHSAYVDSTAAEMEALFRPFFPFIKEGLIGARDLQLVYDNSTDITQALAALVSLKDVLQPGDMVYYRATLRMLQPRRTRVITFGERNIFSIFARPRNVEIIERFGIESVLILAQSLMTTGLDMHRDILLQKIFELLDSCMDESVLPDGDIRKALWLYDKLHGSQERFQAMDTDSVDAVHAYFVEQLKDYAARTDPERETFFRFFTLADIASQVAIQRESALFIPRFSAFMPLINDIGREPFFRLASQIPWDALVPLMEEMRSLFIRPEGPTGTLDPSQVERFIDILHSLRDDSLGWSYESAIDLFRQPALRPFMADLEACQTLAEAFIRLRRDIFAENAQDAPFFMSYFFSIGLPLMGSMLRSVEDIENRAREFIETIRLGGTQHYAITMELLEYVEIAAEYPRGLWSIFLKPLFYDQTTSVMPILKAAHALFNTPCIQSEADIQALTAFITEQGVRAADIINNFIYPAYTDGLLTRGFTEEVAELRTFLSEISYPIREVYEAYKTDPAGLSVLRERCERLHQAIRRGDSSEMDVDPLYSAMQYYVFHPSLTTDRTQYKQLNEQRSDRTSDTRSIPERLQDYEVGLERGVYTLKDPRRPLDRSPWQVILKAIQDVHSREVKVFTDQDTQALARRILELWQGGTLYPDRAAVLTELYEYLQFSRGQSLPADITEITQVMELNQFFGDTITELIREVFDSLDAADPDAYTAVVTKMIKQTIDKPEGKAKAILGIMNRFGRESDEARKNSANVLKLDEDIFARVWESLKGLDDQKEIAAVLRDVRLEIRPDKPAAIVARLLQGNDYKAMLSELASKYAFQTDDGVRRVQFVVSKKKAHGVAGWNMGVCVTPDETLWENPNFMNVIIFDENDIAQGGMHLLVIEENGRTYLTLPGINPSIQLLAEVPADRVYAELIRYAMRIAEALGCDEVLIPIEKGIHSNRPEVQEVIAARGYERFDLESIHDFSFSPHAYQVHECYRVPPLADETRAVDEATSTAPSVNRNGFFGLLALGFMFTLLGAPEFVFAGNGLGAAMPIISKVMSFVGDYVVAPFGIVGLMIMMYERFFNKRQMEDIVSYFGEIKRDKDQIVIRPNKEAEADIRLLEGSIKGILAQGAESVVLAVDGAGGTGKTTLARYLAVTGIAGIPPDEIAIVSRDIQPSRDPSEQNIKALEEASSLRNTHTLIIVEGHGINFTRQLLQSNEQMRYLEPDISILLRLSDEERTMRLRQSRDRASQFTMRFDAAEPELSENAPYDLIFNEPYRSDSSDIDSREGTSGAATDSGVGRQNQIDAGAAKEKADQLLEVYQGMVSGHTDHFKDKALHPDHKIILVFKSAEFERFDATLKTMLYEGFGDLIDVRVIDDERFIEEVSVFPEAEKERAIVVSKERPADEIISSLRWLVFDNFDAVHFIGFMAVLNALIEFVRAQAVQPCLNVDESNPNIVYVDAEYIAGFIYLVNPALLAEIAQTLERIKIEKQVRTAA